MDDIVKHSIKRHCGGQEETSWIQLSCSCGYSSRQVYAYEDYQRTIVNNLQTEHLNKGK